VFRRRRGVRDIDVDRGGRIWPMARKLKTYQTSLGQVAIHYPATKSYIVSNSHPCKIGLIAILSGLCV